MKRCCELCDKLLVDGEERYCSECYTPGAKIDGRSGSGIPDGVFHIKCCVCGERFDAYRFNAKYCAKCRRVGINRQQAARRRQLRAIQTGKKLDAIPAPRKPRKIGKLPGGVLDATEYEKRVRKFVPPPIVCVCAECGAEVRNVPPYLTDCVRVVCKACGGQFEQSGALPSWLLRAAREYGVNCEVNGIGGQVRSRGAA